MKKFTKLLFLLVCSISVGNAFAQTVLGTETFPNSFNTGFTKPINTTFVGSTGTWGAYSSNAYATVSVNNLKFTSSPFGLELLNYNSFLCPTTSYSIATSPVYNCANVCASAVNVCFNLNTYCISSTNNSYAFYVEVSKDNGATWTTIYNKTSAQLFSSFGSGTWNNICLTLPSTFNNSSIKVRFSGAQAAYCSQNTYLFIDDVTVSYTSCAKVALGNLVWLDANGNNTKDAAEVGVPNATVNLYADANNDNVVDGAAIATTTTNASGNYSFTNLNPSNYIVGVIIPAGYTKGAASTVDPDNNVDNDNNGVNLIGTNGFGGEVRSLAITLLGGSEPTTDGDDNNGNQTLDIALCPALTNMVLGNLVWLDLNGNNTKDATEPGVPNATVFLYRDANNDNLADGASIATTTTNASGNYTFTGLTSGNYIVGVIIPANYTRGAASSVDPDNNVDNDNNAVNQIGVSTAGGEMRSLAITLLQGTEPTTDGDDANGNQTLDLALCPAANLLKLGNLVWLDLNGNNIKDATEPVIPNATVKLYADANNDNVADGAAISTTTTDANGTYAFTGLNGGSYIVGVTIPANYTKGANSTVDPDNDVDNDNNGVNLIGANGAGGEVRSLAITLSPFSEPTTDGDDNNGNQTLDFALCPAANLLKLGNLVWLDINANNIKDATEPVIPNATVRLYADANNDNVADGSAIATTTTDANGLYGFSGLNGGNYIVGVVIPSNYQARVNAGNDPDNDIDNDNNGVTLIGANQPGSEIRSLAITLQAFTEPTNDGDDNNGNQSLDFGLCPITSKLSLGNLVWLDVNGNNIKDATEPGIPNATVNLYADANNDNVVDGAAIATTTTNASGNYSFTGLNAGNYIVGVIIPTGYSAGPATTVDPDNDADNDNNGVNLIGANQPGSEERSLAITLLQFTEPTNDGDDNNGNQTLDLALCPAPLLKLGNAVWVDNNANGLKDAGEPGVPNATVYLYKDDNNDNIADGAAIFTTTTDATGTYGFSGLSAGNYIVGVVIPSGYTKGPDVTIDPDNDVDNDNNGVNLVGSEVRSLSITLALYTEPTNDGDDNNGNQTLDIALYPSVCNLGNFVWNDYDGDGKKDPNEPGISNVPVSLYRDDNGDNIPDKTSPIAIATTNTQGFYGFNNLTPGRYITSIPVLPGYTASPGLTGPNPDNDVDNDNNAVKNVGGVLFTNAITLTVGGEPTTDGDGSNGNLTMDMALCGNAYIGDFVWNDLNGNGIQDAGEPGINGQTVTILFPDGVTTATTTTLTFNGVSGYYNFPNLGPGTHVVTFTTPSGLQPSPSNQGSDDTKDSDPVNGSVSVNVVANISDFTIDAGFRVPSILSLGNLLFIDLNGNGVRDLTEPGIPGVTVNLYRDTNGDNAPDGGPIASTISANDGTYQFNNLSADSYIVGAVLPTGYGFSGVFNPLPNNDIDNDNNAVRLVGTEVRTNFITLSNGTEPTNDGDGNNSNLTLDIAMQVTAVCKINGVTYGKETLKAGVPAEPVVENNMSIYPNPAISDFTIKLSTEKQYNGTVWITDLSGKTVLTQKATFNKGTNLLKIAITDKLRSGVYNVQSIIDGKTTTKRLIIAK